MGFVETIFELKARIKELENNVKFGDEKLAEYMLKCTELERELLLEKKAHIIKHEEFVKAEQQLAVANDLADKQSALIDKWDKRYRECHLECPACGLVITLSDEFESDNIKEFMEERKGSLKHTGERH